MTELKNIKKILIIKLRHIGDVLLTIPAIRAAKETFPDASITALVNSGTEDMLEGISLVDEIFVLDRSMFGQSILDRIKYEIYFVKKLRARHFDMAIDFTGGD
ncbi:MAG TPA: putative lipopolysaccharide heptosyltransferase III, partial [Candidatus Nanoarchaeia archaeon]|nr:putative lipopolysaccharide heptosyltransferase III [Candidatus Nanoarchaeia archaeon]